MPERPVPVGNNIYSATYSNVPVYEFNVGANHVMRRRSDDWINATHILKVAEYDKPARTRILEREVQKGVHEKVQGGYGKYQGTWIPLAEGRLLAERNRVLEKLLPILDFVPGVTSPPPAPKHPTASTNKPKVPKQPAATRKAPAKNKANAALQRSQMSDISHDAHSTYETPDRISMASESDVDMIRNSSQYTNQSQNRKRKRQTEEPETMSYQDQQHLLWTDELLDYFMLQSSSDPLPVPPDPPQSIDLNRAIDDKGHTPMHWAAAMADLNVVRDLLQRGARIDPAASNGETPLMRAVLFTNNFDKQTMDRLIQVFLPTAPQKDWCQSTVFHHIVATTCSKSKYHCARYYLDTILDRMCGSYSSQQISHLLDHPDQNGDTAIVIAARCGARKCVRSLLNHGASVNIANNQGQTAEELIEQLNARRRERYGLQNLNVTSSSPVRGGDINGYAYAHPDAPNHHQYGNSSVALHGSLHANNIVPSSATATPASFRHLSSTATKRPRTTTYQSEAAQLLTSQLPVLISSRTEALAAALEAELIDREFEAGEGERVLVTRRQDLAELKARREAVAVEEQQRVLSGQEAEDEDEDVQIRELQTLEMEFRRLIELEQAREIVRLVNDSPLLDAPPSSAEDSGIGMLANDGFNGGKPDGEGGELDTGVTQERLRLARAVARQQFRHARLVDELLAARATASSPDLPNGHEQQSRSSNNNAAEPGTAEGNGQDKQLLYKRLITAALGVPPEDIKALLPDMLRELEDVRRDRLAVFGAVGGGNGDDIVMADAVSASLSAAATAAAHRGGQYEGRHRHGFLAKEAARPVR